MGDRLSYYFKQAVTESELNLGFTYAENADRNLIKDQMLYGIFSGGVVSQHSPLADLTVDVAGPMIGYDPNGQRIATPGLLNVDCSQDSSNVSTTVAGVGNEKWVSITAKFKRNLSDPRVDGNSNTVYFEETEGYEIVVTQGGEAALGTATRPSLDPDGLLLVDVHRTHLQTQIFNADIDATSATGRRQDTYVFSQSPLSIRAGFPKDAVEAMLTSLNAHINGITGHPASAIAYGGGVNWADTSTNPATDVEAQLDKIISDLGGGTAGSAKVSAAAQAGTRFSLSAGTLRSQLVALQGAIDSVVSNGADTIKQVSSIANLRAIVSANRPANSAVVVLDHGIFCYDAARLGVDDGRMIVRPTDVVATAAGRWVSLSYKQHLQSLIRSALTWGVAVTGVTGPLHRGMYDSYRGLIWAVAEGGVDVLKYSPDFGQNWFSQTITGGSGLGSYSVDVDAVGNLVVANDASTRVYAYNFSTNTWSNLVAVTAMAKPLTFYSVTTNLWFIFGYSPAGTTYRVYTSPDRAVWTDDTASLPATFTTAPTLIIPKAGHGNGRAVLAGPAPANVAKLAVRDLSGSGWTEVSLASALAVTSMTNPIYSATDGAWLIAIYGTLAGRNATEFWRSTDNGATWTVVSTLSHTDPQFVTPGQGPQIQYLACNGSLWVGMGAAGEIIYSTDTGTTWYSAGCAVNASGTPLTLFAVGGGFVSFDNAGHIQTSSRAEPVNPTALS